VVVVDFDAVEKLVEEHAALLFSRSVPDGFYVDVGEVGGNLLEPSAYFLGALGLLAFARCRAASGAVGLRVAASSSTEAARCRSAPRGRCGVVTFASGVVGVSGTTLSVTARSGRLGGF
jgi:hypothetical protein